jgi:hypothetical protein
MAGAVAHLQHAYFGCPQPAIVSNREIAQLRDERIATIKDLISEKLRKKIAFAPWVWPRHGTLWL